MFCGSHEVTLCIFCRLSSFHSCFISRMLHKTLFKMKDLEIEPEDLHSSNIESDSDNDICDSDEIDRLFPKCSKWSEHSIASDLTYILHISATQNHQPNVALGLSDFKVEVCSLADNQLAKLETLQEHTDVIVDVKFATDNNNLIYTGSSDGSIKLWDLRTPKKSTLQFVDTTLEKDDTPKIFTCSDISPNNKVICAGLEVSEGDAYVLFWDVRKHDLLGGYWQSHTDDVTQLKFHPDDSNRLMSGSTDGLINLYDLTQATEEDALLDCLNTESSVETLSWFDRNGKDAVSCITHTADLQLWNIDDAEPYSQFSRKHVAEGLKKKTEDFIYLVDTHSTKDGLMLLGGSNAHQGECFRGLKCAKTLLPAVGFTENKQRVRSSWYNKNTNLLLTGGEQGILNTWELDVGSEQKSTSLSKRKSEGSAG